MSKKVVFVTASDIFDKFGNGGSKGSKKNYDLLVNVFGKENVEIVIMTLPEFAFDDSVKAQTKVFEQPLGNKQALIASLFGCKKYKKADEKKILDYITALCPEYVFFDGTTIGKLIRKKAPYKQIVFFHNIEADYSWNKVKNESIKYLPAYFASVINEKKCVYADRIGCLNTRDGKIVTSKYGKNVDFYFPVTFTDCFDETKTRVVNDNRILFLGSFFGPNEEGVDWLVKNVMPELPDMELDIVGKGFEVKKEEYSSYSNVNVIGSVEDTSEYYYSHKVVVMPIFYGAGMKVKTAEAMMYGRRIIATDEALEGYDVEGVDNIYRCNDKEAFLKAIKTAMETSDKTYEKSVRELFMAKYESDVLIDVTKKLFDGLN